MAGCPVNETPQVGISSATYYKWNARYIALDVSDMKQLKELEHENSRLNQMYAHLSLENQALKELIA